MRCRWFCLRSLSFSRACSAATAQPPIEPKDGKYVVPLAVDAVGPARPALKYRLLPELREMQAGNQIPAFYKCFFEQNHLFHNKESTDKQQKWMDAPLEGSRRREGTGRTTAGRPPSRRTTRPGSTP